MPQQQQQPYIVGTTTTKSSSSSSHRHGGHHHDEDDHHRHHHHKGDTGDAAAIGWATWCCVISFSAFILIFVIIAIVASAQSNNVEHHMHQQFTHWQTTMDAQQAQEDTLATRMVTISALGDGTTPGQRRHMLCAGQSYYSKVATGEELHVLTQTIQELREGGMKDFYYYHVSAHIKLSRTRALAAKRQKSYLAIDYNITSSFGRVSTVRLEELEFNTLDQSLGAMRSIVLCTNNPFLDVQRCDAALTKRNILTLYGQESVPLVIALQKEAKKQKTPVTLATGRDDAALHAEQVVDLLDGDEDEDVDEEVSSASSPSSHRDKQRREVIGQRMYNIVFYQNEDTTTTTVSSSRKNKTHPHGTGSLDNADSYKEKRILTLEPIQC